MGTIVNIFLPGLGQLVQGRLFVGLIALCIGMPMTILGYAFFIVPGLLCHALLLAEAYQYDCRKAQERQTRATIDAFRHLKQ